MWSPVVESAQQLVDVGVDAEPVRQPGHVKKPLHEAVAGDADQLQLALHPVGAGHDVQEDLQAGRGHEPHLGQVEHEIRRSGGGVYEQVRPQVWGGECVQFAGDLHEEYAGSEVAAGEAQPRVGVVDTWVVAHARRPPSRSWRALTLLHYLHARDECGSG